MSMNVVVKRKNTFSFCLTMAFVLACFIFVAPAQAGKACEWKDNGWHLSCKASLFCTGCIGLKNVSGKDIRFLVSYPGNVNVHHLLKKGREVKADFGGRVGIAIHTCKKQNSKGKWKQIHCYDAFDRTKNTKSGGGCGCRNLKCLQSW